MRFLVEHQKRVGDEDRDPGPGLLALDRPRPFRVLPVHAEEHDGQREECHQRNVTREDVARKGGFAVWPWDKRGDRRRKANDCQRVEEVRSDDVAEYELVFAAPSRGDRAGEFGKRCPGGDNRKPDNNLWDMESLCDTRCAIKEIRSLILVSGTIRYILFKIHCKLA